MSSSSLLDPRAAVAAARSSVAAWLALQLAGGLDPRPALAALAAEGHDPLRALRRLGAPPPDPRALAAPLAALARAGCRGLVWPSPAYPAALRQLDDAPPLLWVRGEPAWLLRPAVAVVGARVATTYGKRLARELAAELARAGLVVVSGLARGIDAEAHRGALEAGGATVAVLGCGPDRVHPRAHERLAGEIAARGAVVSELAPGAPPLPHHFPLRNRVISGLARAVVVVEARERSGSLITARHALDQGREVLAVPGPVGAPTSAGPHRLLREGAPVALDASDVLRAMGIEPPPASPPAADDPDAAALPPATRRVLRALEREPATADELARRLGLAPGALAAELVRLRLEDRIAEERDGRLHAAGPSRATRLSSRDPCRPT